MASRIDNITSVPSVESVGTRVRLNESEIVAVVDRYLDTFDRGTRTPASGAELGDFLGMIQTVVTSKQTQEGVPSDKQILVVEDDPPESVDTEAITFYLKTRVPGRFDQGPSGAGRIKEVVPHQRSVVPHPEAPSQKLVTAGRFYDNWITFNIYARTNKSARDRLLWFERVMDIYNWFFRLYGFRVVEEGVGHRERMKIDELTVTKYPITYMVRTDDTFQFNTQELKEILIELELSSN